MHVKISDFGLAKELPILMAEAIYVRVESMRGSRGYEAEEYFVGQLGPKVVYTVLILIVIIIRHSPL